MPTLEEQTAIQSVVKDKDIPYLVHFTHVNNLPSILQNGFYPQAKKDDLHAGIAQINDTKRYDNKTDYSCFSIGFPNWRMFYKVRNNIAGSWAVLLINSRILWEKECLFYATNAADNSVRFNDKSCHTGTTALESMYAFSKDYPRENFLKSFDPTDDQAEVMIPGIIEQAYIQSIIFDNERLADSYFEQVKDKEVYFCRPNTKIYTTRKACRHGF